MTVVRFFLLYFTSFSNSRLAYDGSGKFEYYTFLHHSQTTITRTVQGSSLNTIRFYIILKQAIINRLNSFSFEYYTFLHHSQTGVLMLIDSMPFEYYTFLHHSQTTMIAVVLCITFEYYTFLHHSQTKNGIL